MTNPKKIIEEQRGNDSCTEQGVHNPARGQKKNVRWTKRISREVIPWVTLALFGTVTMSGLSQGFTQGPFVASLERSPETARAKDKRFSQRLITDGDRPQTSWQQPLAEDSLLDAHPRPTLKQFGKLPLSFEENHGQVDAQVKYVARGKGYTLFLTETEAVLSLRSAASEKEEGRREKGIHEAQAVNRKANADEALAPRASHLMSSTASRLTPHTSVVRMKFSGANKTPKVSGDDKLPGIVNYFIGNDPDKWQREIPTYKKVEYNNLYDGIDLVYYGNQGQLEYDLVVAPGADPDQIQLAFEGIEHLTVNEKGNLVLAIKEGALDLLKPHVYQLVGNNKVEIAANYVVQAEPYHVSLLSSPLTAYAAVGIQLAGYDTTKPLIIDPVLSYSTYLGGTGNDFPAAIAIDGFGNRYVSGTTNSLDFPTANPQFPAFDAGQFDTFVTKINARGDTLLFSTYLGGNDWDRMQGIDVDGYGNIYVTGETSSMNFPVVNAFQAMLDGTFDNFITKLNSDGSQLLFSTFFGGSMGGSFDGETDWAGLKVDNSGHILFAFTTDSTNLPLCPQPTPQPICATSGGSPFQSNVVGSTDAYIFKMTGDGQKLVYSTYLGGTAEEQAWALTVDNAGNAYVTGETESTDYPTLNPLQASYALGDDSFLIKLDATGAPVYSTYLGGSGNDDIVGLDVDAAGNVYLSGRTTSTDFPICPQFPLPAFCLTDVGTPFQGNYGGGISDTVVAKVNNTGQQLVYSTYLGGSGGESGPGCCQYNELAVDKAGRVSIFGTTNSLDFPQVNSLQVTFAGGDFDWFLSRLSATGDQLEFSTYLGGSTYDDAFSVGNPNLALDAAGNMHVVGSSDSVDFPIVNGLQSSNAGGFSDLVIAKVCNDPTPGTSPGTWIESTGIGNMTVVRAGNTVTRLANGNVLVAGGHATNPAFVPHSSAEIFDATARIFLSTGPMAGGRTFHTATLLPNGKVLVAGGFDEIGTLQSAELYTATSSTSGIFSPTSGSTGGMQVSRAVHDAVLLPNGNVLIAGGFTSGIGDLNTVELYDSATETFSTSPPGPMTSPRQGPTTTLLPDGTVLIVGGSSGGASVNSAEIYDPVAQTFTPTTGQLNTPRVSHRATLLANGKVLITGGRDRTGNNADFTLATAELYDPVSQQFSLTGTMIHDRASHLAMALPDGRILVAGGFTTIDGNGNIGNGPNVSSAELYDPETGLFSLMPPLNVARSGGTLNFTSLSNGQVLLVGGNPRLSTVDIDTAELYTPHVCGSEADILLTVTDSRDPEQIGNAIQVDVQVTNNGPDDAAQVETVTPIPPDLTFDSVLSDPSCTTLDVVPAGSAPGGTATCDFGSVTNGATSLVTFFLQTTSSTPGIKTLSTTAELVGEFDPDFGNNTQTNTTIVQSDATPETDLVLTISDTPDPVQLAPGTYSYTLNVDNMGTDVAINTRVTADVPAGVSLDSATFPGGTCSGIGVGPTTAICNIGDLDVMTAMQIVLNVTATTAGTKTITATATNDATVPDINGTNNTGIEETTLVAGPGQHIFVVDDIGDASDFDLGDDLCSISNGGPCTLRAAIEQANQTVNDPAGPDIIAFSILPGGPQTISPLSQLPPFFDPIILDGTTQPGYAGAPIIEIEGSQAGSSSGIGFSTSDSVMRGFVINRFKVAGGPSAATGVNSGGNNNNLFENNYFGTDMTGNATFPAAINLTYGIIIGVGNQGNVVRNNVLSGNTFAGILIGGPSAQPTANNVVIGNRIGISAANDMPLPNASAGVQLRGNAPGNRIGTDGDGVNDLQERNIISGNTIDGVRIQEGASGNIVAGNYIGTNTDGTVAVPNLGTGITINESSNNLIGGVTGTTPGGACTGACNLISGNGVDGTSSSGIHITGAASIGNQVLGNFVGPDVTGTFAIGSPDFGINLSNLANGTIIGSGTSEGRNVISGQGNEGILISAPPGSGGTINNVVQGNFIGTDTTGTVRLPFLSGTSVGNGASGITILHAANNTIGGDTVITPDVGNVISGNARDGIEIQSGAIGNLVQGNFIGTNFDGSAPVGNLRAGVRIISDPTPTMGNMIGGLSTGQANTISGNLDLGVDLVGANTDNNVVQGNFIGTNAVGSATIGNLFHGVAIQDGAHDNTVSQNVITNNAERGITLLANAGDGNLLTQNQIVFNGTLPGHLGIDLGQDGVTLNDLLDEDGLPLNPIQPNNLQNFPVLTSAASDVAQTIIQGTLNSTPNDSFRIEYFANASCDASGNGEGQTFIGFQDVTTDGTGDVSVNVTLGSVVPVGQAITTTATNLTTNDTSEFSACTTVIVFVPSSPTEVSNTNPSGPGSLAEAVVASNNTVGVDVITFNIPGDGPHTIQPTGSLTLVDPVIIDGTTQPGFGTTCQVCIELDGTNAGPSNPGIFIRTDGSTIKGLAINRFPGNGIRIEPETSGTADNNVIVGNHIGADLTGMVDLGNASDGIQIITSNNNTIGGLTAADRNVISGNGGDGIDIQSSDGNDILGNYIGVDATGEGALGNSGEAGVFVNDSEDNMIGGNLPFPRTVCVAPCNVISANAEEGVQLNQGTTRDNIIQGNYLGLSALGLVLGNVGSGVSLTNNANNNTIGGSLSGEGNVIAGNNVGIFMQGPTGRNVLQGNLIGVDPNGMFTDPTAGAPGSGDEFGNRNSGISILDGSNNCIGGSRPTVLGDPCVAPFAGNVIAGNSKESTFGVGIAISSFSGASVNNSVQGNKIGTDISGTIALGQVDGRGGILLSDDVGTLIGGTEGTTPHIEGVQVGACTGVCNLISGHRGTRGIELRNGSDQAVIEGNYIGTDITGTITDPTPGAPASGDEFGLGTSGSGILLREASTNTRIGGTVPEARNLIAGHGVGINIQDFSSDITIQGNYVGTEKSGTLALPNGVGVRLTSGVTNTLIGGTDDVQPDLQCAGACNLLSGNGIPPLSGGANGLTIGAGATNTTVQGNFIGTTVTGALSLGNQDYGIRVESADNLIGGNTANARNLISGNGQTNSGTSGIFLLEAGATNNQIFGNYIGTTADGQGPIPNIGGRGVSLRGASNNMIGGLQPDEGNVIAGHEIAAISLAPSTSSSELSVGNEIKGNRIGTDVDGQDPIPNGVGIRIANSNNTLIGPANTIEFNTGIGVELTNEGGLPPATTTGNRIFSNRIVGNGGLGIDLSPGTNLDQMAPILSSVSGLASSTTINGTLTSAANTQFNLEFFSNSTCDPSNFGEGETFIGAVTVTTDGTGNVSFSETVSAPVIAGQVISATATDPNNNTSEFSECQIVSQGTGTINIDATALDSTTFSIIGVASGLDATVLQTLQLAPGVYIFSVSDTGAGASFPFTVAGDGSVEDPGLVHVSVMGTNTLVIGGVEITVDATALYADTFDLTGGESLDATQTQQVNVIPGDYQFTVPGSGSGASFPFTVSGDGSVQDPGLAYVSVTGTDTLVVGGVAINVNATALPVSTFSITGGSSLDTTTVQQLNLLPGDYNFDIFGGGLFDFLVTDSGTIDYAVNLNGFIEGRGMTTLIVLSDPGNIGTVFTVNATDDVDDGICDDTHCSLREAINASNDPTNAGVDSIIFEIGAGSQTIRPSSAGLPPLTDSVIIDGTTQPGFSGSPIIELDGSVAGPGIHGVNLLAGSSTIRGLVINRFSGSGINITQQGGNTIEGNYLGTDVTGTVAQGNGMHGISVNSNSMGNIIGGMTITTGNVISGNILVGVSITNGARGNVVLGNFIGTNATGTGTLGNGSNGVGIDTGADSNTIGGSTPAARNIISGNAQDGILISQGGPNGNVIHGNFIGTNATGVSPITNGGSGVDVLETPNTKVGGATSGAGNVISGNSGHGVVIQGNASIGSIIQGNLIGTNAAGLVAVANGANGIVVSNQASNTRIGGTTAVARNIISGNAETGVGVSAGATTTLIQGNYIGTNVEGTAPLGNTQRGIRLDASNNTIGGTVVGARNIISDNGAGIQIFSPGNNNQIQGNFIGTDVTGTQNLGNSGPGVSIRGGAGNSIGGISPGEGNILAFNAGPAVEVSTGSIGNVIRGNSIFLNSGLGLDLGIDGVTLNDTGDSDVGDNNLQNFPVLAGVASDASGTVIQGTFNGQPNAGLELEFFVNDVCDQTGHGEGKTLLTSHRITTDGLGNAIFSVVTVPVSPTQVITSTATNLADGTSEFSACATVSVGSVDVIGPLVPTGLQAEDVANDAGGSITLTWSPSSSLDVTEHRIYRSTTPGGPLEDPYVLIGTIEGMNTDPNLISMFTDNNNGNGLVNGVSYFYIVRAFDLFQESLNSNEFVVQAIDNTPDPETIDTDYDGVTDAVEVAQGTDPTLADSDGDGVSDGGNGDINNDGTAELTPGPDNCPLQGPADQTDTDGDRAGNVCDADDDGDNVADGAGDPDGIGPIQAGPDNCPLVVNPSQRNTDGLTDGGDACDPDADEDGFPLLAADGVTILDCQDLNVNINPGILADLDGDGVEDVAGGFQSNGVDDDCNGLTFDSPLQLVVTLSVAGADPPLESCTDRVVVAGMFGSTTGEFCNWLPTPGDEVTVTVGVNDGAGPVTGLTPTITVASVSAFPGQYTNDDSESEGSAAPDYSGMSVTGGQVTMTVEDYGATLELQVTATDGTRSVDGTVRIPEDVDGDQLADYWEMEVVGADLDPEGDEDNTAANEALPSGILRRAVGDGLNNHEEYRGSIWGPELMTVEAEASGGKYQTAAILPSAKEGALHVRTSPKNWDLFVAAVSYDFGPQGLDPANSGVLSRYDDPRCDCPFALGTAFQRAGIDVHVVSLQNAEYRGVQTDPDVFTVLPDLPQANIDVAIMVNDLSRPAGGGHLGPIFRRGGPILEDPNGVLLIEPVRDWTWSGKGETAQAGTATAYLSPSFTYQRALDHYFGDTPYVDDPAFGELQILDPINDPLRVEDGNDDAIHVSAEDTIPQGQPGILDGDQWRGAFGNPIGIDGWGEDPETGLDTTLSPMDVNNNGLVELPLAGSVSEILNNLTTEYTKAQCLKSTLTHELAHLAGFATQAPDRHAQAIVETDGTVRHLLMEGFSWSWNLDKEFDEEAEARFLKIHNN